MISENPCRPGQTLLTDGAQYYCQGVPETEWGLILLSTLLTLAVVIPGFIRWRDRR